MDDIEARRREQHKLRLSWMPWLYFSLKPRHRAWAEAWQKEVQDRLRELETVEIAEGCFVAPEARLFAEPGRAIRLVGPGVSIAAHVFLDGGAGGIHIGEGSRIATGAALYAFDHGLAPDRPVRSQPVTSRGIVLGKDVWVGANAGITDGVRIGDHAVVGMGAVVTRDVPPWAIVAGVPARVLGDRRERRRSGAPGSGWPPDDSQE